MNPNIFWNLCDDVFDERMKQEAKHGPQFHLPDSTDNPNGRETWETIARNSCDRAFRENRLTLSHIFDEETAEAMTAAAKGDVKALRKELVQVAAVALQWLEAIQRREDYTSFLKADLATLEALIQNASEGDGIGKLSLEARRDKVKTQLKDRLGL